MEKYREAAVLAVQLLHEGTASDPLDAWSRSMQKIFPNSEDLRKKGCPKGAFLGLCNVGLIQGIDPGSYAKPTKNGDYAVSAVEILRANRFLTSQPDMLWKKVAGNKSENNQMDVVVGLWIEKLINT